MAKRTIIGLMEGFIKGTGLKTPFMVKASIIGLQRNGIKVSFMIERDMHKAQWEDL